MELHSRAHGRWRTGYQRNACGFAGRCCRCGWQHLHLGYASREGQESNARRHHHHRRRQREIEFRGDFLQRWQFHRRDFLRRWRSGNRGRPRYEQRGGSGCRGQSVHCRQRQQPDSGSPCKRKHQDGGRQRDDRQCSRRRWGPCNQRLSQSATRGYGERARGIRRGFRQ